MGEDEWGHDVLGDAAEVAVVPGRLRALEHAGRVSVAVPADPEAVAVRRLDTEVRVETLVDQRVLGLVEQGVDRDRRAGISEPAAHLFSLRWRSGLEARRWRRSRHRPDRM